MSWLTKKKSILASVNVCDLKNKNEVARDNFFLDFYFSIGGSVHAQKKELTAKKALMEEKKLTELVEKTSGGTLDHTIQEMKKMDIDETMVLKVQEKLENEARENVRQVLGNIAYDTYD